MEQLQLRTGDTLLTFDKAPLLFHDLGPRSDLFGAKNNKTLRQTLAHRRYSSLAVECSALYPAHLDTGIGEFLTQLKYQNDPYYQRFLNSHGDGAYCTFGLAPSEVCRQKGLYAYTALGELRYIGRCLDNFGKRINQGYGKIHPKNCFRDGQTTNCHLNALICQNKNGLCLFLLALQADEEICHLERELIRAYDPPWNIQLRKEGPLGA